MEKSATRYDTYSTRTMRYWLCAFLVGVALTGGACSSNDAAAARESSPPPSDEARADTPAQAAASKRPRIVFLGDSLTAGYGLDLEQSVPALVQKQLDAEG